MNTRLTCTGCNQPPDFQPSADTTRLFCTSCVTNALRPGGRSLNFPRDVQIDLIPQEEAA